MDDNVLGTYKGAKLVQAKFVLTNSIKATRPHVHLPSSEMKKRKMCSRRTDTYRHPSLRLLLQIFNGSFNGRGFPPWYQVHIQRT